MASLPSSLPAVPVHLIGKSRMVTVQLSTVRQNLIGKSIQVTDSPREPRNHRHIVTIVTRDHTEVAADVLQLLDGLAQRAGLAVAFNKELIAGNTIRRP